ncbi:DNA repair protein RecO [Lacihabitans lacunae]|uniref:DNA repair protein RecO n=1 Tax=Lacihabitans lacunae TaxID=1028214 RepID=A0ABV7Z107_9BACT
MLHKTSGIVISYILYRETSIIVKVYTEKFGIQTYIENGVRSSKGKNKIALFQPLTILDLVVYHDPKKDINRLSEIKCPNPLLSIPYNIKKSSIALFINEILSKSLKEHAENIEMYNFLITSIDSLDKKETQFENFHLVFLLHFAFYIGFGAESATEIKNQLYEFALQIPIDKVHESSINLLLKSNYEDFLPLKREHRSQVLDILIGFYQIHIEGFGEIKSVSVLKTVLDS